MKDTKTVIKDIIAEETALDEKLRKLEYFFMTDDYANNITQAQKALLVKQHKIMGEYKGVLIQRAHLLNKEGAGKEDHLTEESEAPAGFKPIKNEKCLTCKYCLTLGIKKLICVKRDAKGDCYEEDK